MSHKAIENKLEYSFKDRQILQKALTHSSYANENKDKHLDSNERLEFLGDSVLGMIVARTIFTKYPNMPEGKMTKLRAQLVCEEALHRIALELNLGEYIRLGRGEERSGGRERVSILADAVEAIIAAMFLDGGIDVAEDFIKRYVLIGLKVEFSNVIDYKTKLQEEIQKTAGNHISYEMVGEEGPDHKKTFTARVLVNNKAVGEGVGHTKKEAEQAAAAKALEAMAK